MATDKPKTLTPVEEIAQLRTQLETVSGELVSAKESVTSLTAKHLKATEDLTARTNELIEERGAHSTTKLSLQGVTSQLTATKAELATLKTDIDGKVQTKAAELAAQTGHPAVAAAAPKAPGSVEEPKDKMAMSATELFASDLKAANQPR